MTRTLFTHPTNLVVPSFCAPCEKVGHSNSFRVSNRSSKLNCHPERRSPWRPESKDLHLLLGELGTNRRVPHARGVFILAARVGNHPSRSNHYRGHP